MCVFSLIMLIFISDVGNLPGRTWTQVVLALRKPLSPYQFHITKCP